MIDLDSRQSRLLRITTNKKKLGQNSLGQIWSNLYIIYQFTVGAICHMTTTDWIKWLNALGGFLSLNSLNSRIEKKGMNLAPRTDFVGFSRLLDFCCDAKNEVQGEEADWPDGARSTHVTS